MLHQSYDDLWFKELLTQSIKIKAPDFEESYPIIEKEVEKRRCKWSLSAVPHMDYDDVKQIIITHIFNKWYQYNPSKGALEPWLSRIVLNKIKNLLRDHYYTYAKVCKGCPCSLGDDSYCTLFGSQDSTHCLVLKKWEGNKAHAFNIKIPVSTENHEYEITSKTHKILDIEKAIEQLGSIFKKRLTTLEYKVFNLIFIQHKTEADAITTLGYKIAQGKEHKSNVGYKVVNKAKKKIIEIATEVIYGGEVDMYYE